MNKIALALLGAPAGLVIGALLGATWFHAAFGTGSHMDASGLVGALFGAPIGAALGVLIGFGIGYFIDRYTGSNRSSAALKRFAIPVGLGGAIGLVALLFTGNPGALIICVPLAGLAGWIWNLVAELRDKHRLKGV